MQATHLSLSGSIKIINGVGLTPREIDIIACLLSGKGTKAIATLLSMSPRTVETHTRAIMIKFGCNSKEGIIEFIEHSEQFYQLKNHYLHLLQQAKFKQALQKIALLNKNQLVTYVVCSTKSRKSQHLIDELTVYLNLAGLKIKVEKRPKIILPELAFIGGAICKDEAGNLAPVLFLLSDLVNATEVPDEIRRTGYVNFDLDLDLDDQVNTSDSFYEQVFAIIQKLLPDLSLDLVINEFKKDIQVTSAEDLTLLPKHQTLKIHPSKIKSILIFAFAVLFGLVILGFNLNHLKLFLSNL
ncbi:MAG: helix-turn-helix transcriptional regulator [Alphaproteobacteria bacterium]